MGGTCGKWVQYFTLVLTVLNLMGNGTAQIVAGAANTYSINPVLTKRCAPLPPHLPTIHPLPHAGLPSSLLMCLSYLLFHM